MKSAQIALLFTVLIFVVSCSSLPPYGKGTYGFFAPEGVSPEVVAGNIFWEIDPPETRGFRGVFWLERPLLDKPDEHLEEADNLPFLNFDKIEQIGADHFPQGKEDFGIFALQSDETIKAIPLSDSEARSVLEEIRVYKHLRSESEASDIFRRKIAPHLTALHTPITWHWGRSAKSPYWVPQKFRDQMP